MVRNREFGKRWELGKCRRLRYEVPRRRFRKEMSPTRTSSGGKRHHNLRCEDWVSLWYAHLVIHHSASSHNTLAHSFTIPLPSIIHAVWTLTQDTSKFRLGLAVQNYVLARGIWESAFIWSLVRVKAKGKAIPLHAWTGPYGSRMLRLPEFLYNRHKMVVRLSALSTGRL